MSVCERKVYPPDVVKYVKDQLKQIDSTDQQLASKNELPESMQVTEHMKEESASLRDALVSVSL